MVQFPPVSYQTTHEIQTFLAKMRIGIAGSTYLRHGYLSTDANAPIVVGTCAMGAAYFGWRDCLLPEDGDISGINTVLGSIFDLRNYLVYAPYNVIAGHKLGSPETVWEYREIYHYISDLNDEYLPTVQAEFPELLPAGDLRPFIADLLMKMLLEGQIRHRERDFIPTYKLED